jgi:hypothetical protein
LPYGLKDLPPPESLEDADDGLLVDSVRPLFD